MNKKQWQEKYEVTDDEMVFIETVLKMFNGKIVSVEDLKEKKND